MTSLTPFTQIQWYMESLETSCFHWTFLLWTKPCNHVLGVYKTTTKKTPLPWEINILVCPRVAHKMPTTFPHSTFKDFHCLTGSQLTNLVWTCLWWWDYLQQSTEDALHLHTLSQRVKNCSFPVSDLRALSGDSPEDVAGYKTEHTPMNFPL